MSFIFSRTGGIVSIIANELLHNKLQNSDQRGPVQYWRSGLSNIITYGDTTADVSFLTGSQNWKMQFNWFTQLLFFIYSL